MKHAVRALWIALSLSGVLGVYGCASHDHPPIVSKDDPGGAPTRTSGTGPTDAGLDVVIPADACSQLKPPEKVQEVFSAAPQPAPLGGVIADGVYHTTALIVYGPDDKVSRYSAERFRFAGSQFEHVDIEVDGTVAWSSGTYLVSAPGDAGPVTLLTFKALCPSGAEGSTHYTVSANTIKMYTNNYEITYAAE